MKHLKLFFIFSFTLLFIAGCSEDTSEIAGTGDDPADEIYLEKLGDVTAEFEITIENLTPLTGDGSSQPLSPPVIATHNASLRIFKLNHKASDELQQVAEDAVNDPLVQRLENSARVFNVVTGNDVILPGSSATYTIYASSYFVKLSFVSMLVNTNDGFTGIVNARLPKNGSVTYYTDVYDAGTEENTELIAHIPGPCCGNPLVRVPTQEKIQYHPGILGIGDLDPAVYNWTGKGAKITITRVN